MSASTDQGNVIVGFPLSPGAQAKLAATITETQERGESKIVAAWCEETGFFLACHISDGQPCYWECSGPITQRQADELSHSLKDLNAGAGLAM